MNEATAIISDNPEPKSMDATMTTPAMFAIALNNEGLAHLEARCYDHAIQNITKALGIVREELSSTQTMCYCKGCVCTSGMQSDLFEFRMCKEVPHEVSDDAENELFLFKNPMKIHMHHTATLKCYDYFVSLSYIILFNLALAYHLLGIEHDNQRALQKALRLYELSYTVHIKEDLTLTALQALAIVNNLGHVHRELGNLDNSRQCFENLLSSLMYVQISIDEETMQHVDGFTTNAVSCILECPKSAAAA